MFEENLICSLPVYVKTISKSVAYSQYIKVNEMQIPHNTCQCVYSLIHIESPLISDEEHKPCDEEIDKRGRRYTDNQICIHALFFLSVQLTKLTHPARHTPPEAVTTWLLRNQYNSEYCNSQQQNGVKR